MSMLRKKMFSSFKHSRTAAVSMLMSFCMTGAVFAQKGMIKGTVVDENGEPVIGANVLVKGTTNGTITDMDGNYVINVENMKNVVLQVSYVGYNSIEEAVKGRNTVPIKLESSVVNLGEFI